MKIIQNDKIKVFLSATLCCFLWGSAFPVIKMGYQYFNIPADQASSQILFAGIRFSLAGMITIFIGSIFAKKMLIPKRGSWKNIFILSLFQTFLQYIFFYIGLAHTTGVKASIINPSSVFMAILISGLIFHQEKLTKKKIFACAIGFLGVIAANATNKTSLSFNMNGDFLILLSALAYAISSVLIKLFSGRESPVVLSGYQFFVGGAAMILCGLMMGGKLHTITTAGIFSILWLAIVSACAYSLWGILLKNHRVSQITIYSFFIPVFGVLLSALLLGESREALGIQVFLSLVLVSAGIVLINTANEKE